MPDVIEEAVAGLREGEPIVLPTDTVYGLCASAYRDAPTLQVYRLKGRPVTMPAALLCSDMEMLLECVPELRGRAAMIARSLLPGPYTLVLPNPARRFRWLTGDRPETIGVRVPSLPPTARGILDRVGCVIASSANVHGGTEPRRVSDVPDEILTACRVVVDGGVLPGIPSTVIDFTDGDPRVLREGAVPAIEALGRAALLG